MLTYAADAVTVSMETVTAEVGQQISISVHISENSQMTGGNLLISYDNNVLRLDSFQQAALMQGYSCIVNSSYSANQAKASWAGTQALNVAGNMFSLNFTVLQEVDQTEIMFDKLKLADSNGNVIPAIIQNGGVRISSKSASSVVLPSDFHTNNSARVEESVKKDEWKATVFSDVKETDWYYEAVKFAVEKGITNGVSDTEYAPNDCVTRGQFITMLCRAYGIKEMSGDNFSDCGNTWYTGYLAAAKQLGISNGVGDNKFAPKKEISREEMVTLIYNYMKFAGDVVEEANGTSFADQNEISSWAKPGVAFASSKGYVNGKGNNFFDPAGNATRAELAQIFYNILQ